MFRLLLEPTFRPPRGRFVVDVDLDVVAIVVELLDFATLLCLFDLFLFLFLLFLRFLPLLNLPERLPSPLCFFEVFVDVLSTSSMEPV